METTRFSSELPFPKISNNLNSATPQQSSLGQAHQHPVEEGRTQGWYLHITFFNINLCLLTQRKEYSLRRTEPVFKFRTQ